VDWFDRNSLPQVLSAAWYRGAAKSSSIEVTDLRYGLRVVLGGALLPGSTHVALTTNVRTDFKPQTNFSQYDTDSWGKVQTSDPFVDRIKQTVDQQSQSKGW